MLGLTLRPEFTSAFLRGTAIELRNDSQSGATQVGAASFLEITYPTGDVIEAIRAVGPDKGRPLVIMGERGQGKSHVLGVLYHALRDPVATASWLTEWSSRLASPDLAAIPLRPVTMVIAESMHQHEYPTIWDMLFDRHPHGAHVRGMWAGQSNPTAIPSRNLVQALFSHTPTVLILDEFQTWFDSLDSSDARPDQLRAFNFIQILSEIAGDHPELLVLVVTVRNGDGQSYAQLNRVGPSLVTFRGPHARRDRGRLLLHRLFSNRAQVPPSDIVQAIAPHVNEFLRLTRVPDAEHQRSRDEFLEAWPFSPELLRLLEDQILVATQAQETRDLIRILAGLFKERGLASPVLTPADFRVDREDSSPIVNLIDSLANDQFERLGERARRNITAVHAAVPDHAVSLPNLSAVIGSLWLRSLAVQNPGADPDQLRVDITGAHAIDDNGFQVELDTITSNSFNIHRVANRLVFKLEDNPAARLLTNARNPRQFDDGRDLRRLHREIKYVFTGDGASAAGRYRVVVLGPDWEHDPWAYSVDTDLPSGWGDLIPLIVLPATPDQPNPDLGRWLKDHVPERRNTVRFLVPTRGTVNLYTDPDVLVTARAVTLGEEWGVTAREYADLANGHKRDLRAIVSRKFDACFFIDKFDFQFPQRSEFQRIAVTAQGDRVSSAIHDAVRERFEPENFRDYLKEASEASKSLHDVLEELRATRPNRRECIPWLGKSEAIDEVIRACAKRLVAIDIRGTEWLQAGLAEAVSVAEQRMRPKVVAPGDLKLIRVCPVTPEQDVVTIPPPDPSRPSFVIPPVPVQIPNLDQIRIPVQGPGGSGVRPAGFSGGGTGTSSSLTGPEPTHVRPSRRLVKRDAKAGTAVGAIKDEFTTDGTCAVRNIVLTVPEATVQQLIAILEAIGMTRCSIEADILTGSD